MNASDLLDIDKIKKIDASASKVKRSADPHKRLRISSVETSKVYHTRLGTKWWREHFRWNKKAKERVKKVKQKRNSKKQNRFIVHYKECPKRYEIYIKSDWWEKRKNDYYQKYPKKCAVCGTAEHVNLHHTKYGNYGKELDEHLIPLCQDHHLEFHLKYGKGMGKFEKKTLNFIMEKRDEELTENLIRHLK